VSRYLYPRPLPKRQPGSKRGEIEVALRAEIDDLRDSSPTGRARTTLRFLQYRLASAGVIVKGTRQEGDVSLVLSQLRWSGDVGFDEIVDRKRRVLDFTGYVDLREGATKVIRTLRLDPWGGKAPLLIVESESLAGLLEDLAYEFRIPLVAASGQSSDSLVWEIAGWVERGHVDAPYVGDHDFSGPHIENAIRDRVTALTGVDFAMPRVALTEEQVDEHGLPTIMKLDGRTKRRHPAVETEALDQRILLPIIREQIEGRLAVDLDEVERDEQKQRDALIARLEDES